jgi:hypothetical protein
MSRAVSWYTPGILPLRRHSSEITSTNGIYNSYQKS